MSPAGTPAPIRYRTIGSIGIRSRSKLNTNTNLLKDVRKAMGKALFQFKNDIMNPRNKPKLHPSNPVPIAAGQYHPIMFSGKRAKKTVPPGRLRRASGLGFRWKGGRGLVSLRKGTTVQLKWGITQKEFSGAYLNYANYVARMSGTATGGGGRYRFQVRYRKFLQKNLTRLIREVNTKFNLKSDNGLYFIAK